jgi:hypothetical protein
MVSMSTPPAAQPRSAPSPRLLVEAGHGQEPAGSDDAARGETDDLDEAQLVAVVGGSLVLLGLAGNGFDGLDGLGCLDGLGRRRGRNLRPSHRLERDRGHQATDGGDPEARLVQQFTKSRRLEGVELNAAVDGHHESRGAQDHPADRAEGVPHALVSHSR